jgi:hypothetical protein
MKPGRLRSGFFLTQTIMTKSSARRRPGSAATPQLPARLLTRIRWIHDVLGEVDGMSLEESIESFRRDLHPADEVRIWQRLAAVYGLYNRRHPGLSLREKREVYAVLFSLSMGVRDVPNVGHLDAVARTELHELLRLTRGAIQ